MTIEGAATSARMAGEERRLQILAVAVSLFSQKGFRGTTTKEIATAAGVSEAMVFRHFATKEELYSAILDHKACASGRFDPAETAADAIARKDDRAVFETLALGALDHHENDPQFQRLLLHSIGSPADAAATGDRIAQSRGVVRVRVVTQHALDRRAQLVHLQSLQRHQFSAARPRDARRDARLVVGYRDRHHRHAARQRLQRGVQSGVGDAQLGPLEQL